MHLTYWKKLRSAALMAILLAVAIAIFMATSLGSCTANERQETISAVSNNVEILRYTNSGRLYNSIQANGQVKLTPNSYREYGYDSDGHWTYQWATSSAITIEANGHAGRICGSTIIVKDAELEIVTENFAEWLTRLELGKVAILMSQDGSRIIGLIGGNSINDDVSKDLPKTTVLTVDGKQALVHRANYEIIDRALLDAEQLAHVNDVPTTVSDSEVQPPN